MKVVYQIGSRKTFEEMDWEAQEAVRKAIELIKGKTGFRTYSEVWRNCSLTIILGHNIYTTSIQIRPDEKDVIARRNNWHNGYAYYCNGVFWANFSRIKVELI